MTAVKRIELVSEEEFLSLPESMNKIELIDGEVIVPPAPTFGHQEVLSRVAFQLRSWAAGCAIPVTVGQSPLDIRFAPDRILQPDAFVILERVPLTHKGPLDRIPEICIEVLSGDRLYDRVTKRLIYAAAGVQELWLVAPAGVIERWSGAGLERREELRDLLRSPLLPEFELTIPSLFEGP